MVDLSRWMYVYPQPKHIFPVVGWKDDLPVIAASRALVELVASQADPSFPALDVDSPALWNALQLFRKFKVRVHPLDPFSSDHQTWLTSSSLACLVRT